MSARRDRGVRWRRAITPFLKRQGFDIFDPTVEESRYLDFLKDNQCEDFHELKVKNADAYALLMEMVENHDLELVQKASHVLFYFDPPAFRSDGTIIEFLRATEWGKEIFVVLNIPKVKIPGWTFRRIERLVKPKGRLFYSFTDLRVFLKGK